MLAVGGRDPAHERHTDLRTETRRETECVSDGILAALGQIQCAQLGIDFLEVWNGRYNSGLEDLYRYGLFHPNAHGVAGVPLGVGDDDFVCRLSKHVP